METEKIILTLAACGTLAFSLATNTVSSEAKPVDKTETVNITNNEDMLTEIELDNNN